MGAVKTRCDHTQQRHWIYGGHRENAFQCPCGEIFTLKDVSTPPAANGWERLVVTVTDRLSRLFGKVPDCDAGDYLVPSLGY